MVANWEITPVFLFRGYFRIAGHPGPEGWVGLECGNCGGVVKHLRKAISLFVAALVLSIPVRSQVAPRSPCVVADIDTPTMPACVIRSQHGGMFIPSRYWMHPAFNQYGLAPFTIQSFGRVYVNRRGRIVIQMWR